MNFIIMAAAAAILTLPLLAPAKRPRAAAELHQGAFRELRAIGAVGGRGQHKGALFHPELPGDSPPPRRKFSITDLRCDFVFLARAARGAAAERCVAWNVRWCRVRVGSGVTATPHARKSTHTNSLAVQLYKM